MAVISRPPPSRWEKNTLACSFSIIRSLHEDVRNLHVPLLPGPLREVAVAVPRLRLTCKGLQKVLLGFRPLDGIRHVVFLHKKQAAGPPKAAKVHRRLEPARAQDGRGLTLLEPSGY